MGICLSASLYVETGNPLIAAAEDIATSRFVTPERFARSGSTFSRTFMAGSPQSSRTRAAFGWERRMFCRSLESWCSTAVSAPETRIEMGDADWFSSLELSYVDAGSRDVPEPATVRQLETGKPVGIPISNTGLGGGHRRYCTSFPMTCRTSSAPSRMRLGTRRLGEPAMNVRLKVDPDRANLSGVTNLVLQCLPRQR